MNLLHTILIIRRITFSRSNIKFLFLCWIQKNPRPACTTSFELSSPSSNHLEFSKYYCWNVVIFKNTYDKNYSLLAERVTKRISLRPDSTSHFTKTCHEHRTEQIPLLNGQLSGHSMRPGLALRCRKARSLGNQSHWKNSFENSNEPN